MVKEQPGARSLPTAGLGAPFATVRSVSKESGGTAVPWLRVQSGASSEGPSTRVCVCPQSHWHGRASGVAAAAFTNSASAASAHDIPRDVPLNFVAAFGGPAPDGANRLLQALVHGSFQKAAVWRAHSQEPFVALGVSFQSLDELGATAAAATEPGAPCARPYLGFMRVGNVEAGGLPAIKLLALAGLVAKVVVYHWSAKDLDVTRFFAGLAPLATATLAVDASERARAFDTLVILIRGQKHPQVRAFASNIMAEEEEQVFQSAEAESAQILRNQIRKRLRKGFAQVEVVVGAAKQGDFNAPDIAAAKDLRPVLRRCAHKPRVLGGAVVGLETADDLVSRLADAVNKSSNNRGPNNTSIKPQGIVQSMHAERTRAAADSARRAARDLLAGLSGGGGGGASTAVLSNEAMTKVEKAVTESAERAYAAATQGLLPSAVESAKQSLTFDVAALLRSVRKSNSENVTALRAAAAPALQTAKQRLLSDIERRKPSSSNGQAMDLCYNAESQRELVSEAQAALENELEQLVASRCRFLPATPRSSGLRNAPKESLLLALNVGTEEEIRSQLWHEMTELSGAADLLQQEVTKVVGASAAVGGKSLQAPPQQPQQRIVHLNGKKRRLDLAGNSESTSSVSSEQQQHVQELPNNGQNKNNERAKNGRKRERAEGSASGACAAAAAASDWTTEALSKFPHICEELQKLKSEAVVKSELVALQKDVNERTTANCVRQEVQKLREEAAVTLTRHEKEISALQGKLEALKKASEGEESSLRDVTQQLSSDNATLRREIEVVAKQQALGAAAVVSANSSNQQQQQCNINSNNGGGGKGWGRRNNNKAAANQQRQQQQQQQQQQLQQQEDPETAAASQNSEIVSSSQKSEIARQKAEILALRREIEDCQALHRTETCELRNAMSDLEQESCEQKAEMRAFREVAKHLQQEVLALRAEFGRPIDGGSAGSHQAIKGGDPQQQHHQFSTNTNNSSRTAPRVHPSPPAGAASSASPLVVVSPHRTSSHDNNNEYENSPMERELNALSAQITNGNVNVQNSAWHNIAVSARADHDRFRERMLRAGVAIVLAKSLHRNPSNTNIILNCCDAICALISGTLNEAHSAATGEEAMRRFGDAGVCQTLVGLVKAPPRFRSEHVVAAACRAIALLSPHPENRQRLNSCEVCRSINAVLKQRTRSSRQDAGDYTCAVEACNAAAAIAVEPRMSKSFGDLGICQPLVEALKKYDGSRDASLQAQALRAVMNLAADNESNTESLGAAGACASARAAIIRYADDFEVQRWACGAIANLAVSDVNRQRLGESGACEAAVGVLRRHHDKFELVHEGLVALRNLASGNADNISKLCEAGAKEHVEKAMQTFRESEDIQQHGMASLRNLKLIS